MRYLRNTAAKHAAIYLLGYPGGSPPSSQPNRGCTSLTLSAALERIGFGWFDFQDGVDFVNKSVLRPIRWFDDLTNGWLRLSSDQGLFEIGSKEGEFLAAWAGELNSRLADLADEVGVHFVDVADEFKGHEPCGGSGADWLNGVEIEPTAFDGKLVDIRNMISDRSISSNKGWAQGIMREYYNGISEIGVQGGSETMRDCR